MDLPQDIRQNFINEQDWHCGQQSKDYLVNVLNLLFGPNELKSEEYINNKISKYDEKCQEDIDRAKQSFDDFCRHIQETEELGYGRDWEMAIRKVFMKRKDEKGYWQTSPTFQMYFGDKNAMHEGFFLSDNPLENEIRTMFIGLIENHWNVRDLNFDKTAAYKLVRPVKPRDPFDASDFRSFMFFRHKRFNVRISHTIDHDRFGWSRKMVYFNITPNEAAAAEALA